LTVVQRNLGRSADDHQHLRRVEVEVVEDSGIGVEVRKVVLLLQPRVAEELARSHAVSFEPRRRDRVRNDHPGRGTAAELVLEPGELVVEGRGAWDAQGAGDEREAVRSLGEREGEPTRGGK